MQPQPTLAETTRLYPGTGYPWFSDTDGADVDPFDLIIWDRGQPTDEGYDEDAFVTGVRERIRPTIIAARPKNDELILNPAEFIDDLKDRNDIPQAVMADAGVAVAVAAAGADPTVGTGGVGPCVAVLARARSGAGVKAVGCIHLSADDMQTLALTQAAIGRVYTQIVAALGGAPAPGSYELFALGGTTADDLDAPDEWARVIAACQLAPGATFAGALIPACTEDDQYIDVFIDHDEVNYSRLDG